MCYYTVNWCDTTMFFACIFAVFFLSNAVHCMGQKTRSPAVARIADRTASQQTLVIIAIVLIGLVYYECNQLNLEETKTNKLQCP